MLLLKNTDFYCVTQINCCCWPQKSPPFKFRAPVWSHWLLLAKRWRHRIDVSRSSCPPALSWGQRCYVNWLLFRKWGRSPSYEQGPPLAATLWPPSKMSSTCTHDFWWQSSVDKDNSYTPHHHPPPSRPALCSHLSVQNDALALPPCRQINQWKMSVPECRFVGVGVAAAAGSSPPCIWFYACLWAAAEPWVIALLPWLHSDWFSPSELSFLVPSEKRFARKTAKRKEML